MPAARTLVEHVSARTFRSRRHHELLAGPVLRWPAAAELQSRYAGASHELERRAIGVEFERCVRDGTFETADDHEAARELEQALDELLRAEPVLVDLAGGRLTVSGQLGLAGERVAMKTAASAATLRLLPALERELRAHRSRQAERDLRLVHADAFVFVTATGRPQSQRNVLRAMHKAGFDAGLNGDGRERVGNHDLRHSFVSGTFAAGASLPEIASLARHANARVTAQVYAGLTENGREAASAKLLESGFGR
jgi:hypothetical protein